MPRAIDFFCGAGGWTLACQELGIDECGIDNNKWVQKTRAAAGFDTILGDVADIHPTKTDLLVSSSPCQPFSLANWKVGVDIDKMLLTGIVLNWVGKARTIVMENVKRATASMQEVEKGLIEAGYYTWLGDLNSEQYGTPQARKRTILIASLDHKVGMPVATHSKYHRKTPDRLDNGVLPWNSMASALPHRTDLPDWAHVRPSPTIVGSFRPDIVAAPGWRVDPKMPRQNTPNSATVESWEAGVLQDFPADFPFAGGKKARFMQVGNAIPVRMAKAILQEALNGSSQAGEDR